MRRIQKIISTKGLIFLLIWLFGISSEYTQTSKVYVDIKTHLNEKIQFAPIQCGIIYMLSNNESLAYREFGEDYSVWLSNYKAFQRNNSVKITLTLEGVPRHS